MTPTEAITALEKALEAGPTPGEWMYLGTEPFTTPDDAFAHWGAFRISANSLDLNDDDYYRIGSVSNRNGSGQNEANAALIAACSPLAIRTLLDAHAGALRDAERYRWLRSKGIVLAGHDFISFDDTADFRIDRAMSALATNTKAQP